MPQTQDVIFSTAKVHLIREEKIKTGGVRLIDAWMPVGKGYGKGNEGALDWLNKGLGWQSYDEYMAKKNSAEAEKTRTDAAVAAAVAVAVDAEKKKHEEKGKK